MNQGNLKIAEPASPAEAAVGRKIRSLRRDLGLSLQALASGTGLSIGLISQIERGLSSPSLKNLFALGEALGVNIGWFFDAAAEIEDEGEGLIVRREARRAISMNGDGIRKELLSPDQDRSLQLFMISIEVGGGSGPEYYAHGGEVAAFVLSGSLLLWIDERRFLLRTGDSFAIPANTPRRYENPDPMQEVKLLWSISYAEDAPRPGRPKEPKPRGPGAKG